MILASLRASQFVREVVGTFSTRVFLIGIGIVTSVVIARALGPDGRGAYAVAAALGGLGVQLGTLGIHASSVYALSKDRSQLPALLGNALGASLVFGGLVGAVLALVCHAWPSLAPAHGGLFLLALLSIPVGISYLLLQNLLLGIQDIRAFNISDIANRCMTVGIVGMMILASTIAVETVFAAGLVALATCTVGMTWRLAAAAKKPPIVSAKVFLANVRYGLKAYAADLLAFLTLRANVLIVQNILGDQQTGYYSVATATSDIVYTYPLVIGTIFFPKLATMATEAEQWSATRKLATQVAAQMAVLCALAYLLARPAMILVYGGRFEPAVPVFHILVLGVFFLSVETILFKYLAARGFPFVIIAIWLSILAISLPLNVVLTQRWGVLGAAAAGTLTNAFLLSLVWWLTLRHVRLGRRRAAGEVL